MNNAWDNYFLCLISLTLVVTVCIKTDFIYAPCFQYTDSSNYSTQLNIDKLFGFRYILKNYLLSRFILPLGDNSCFL